MRNLKTAILALLIMTLCSYEESFLRNSNADILFSHSQQEMELNTNQQNVMEKTIEETKSYIGMWVTKDGYIRHELKPNNKYDEARGIKQSAYQGSYKVTGNHIDYRDDTGFSADGEFKDGVLYHAGMILFKESGK